MAAKNIEDMVYLITDLTTTDVASSEITDTYIPMAVKKIESLVPDWGYTVTSKTTGDVMIDKIVAEWCACFIDDEKGHTPYDPETGETIRMHCEYARELLLDQFGVPQKNGTKLFPSEITGVRAYVGGLRLCGEY